MSSFLGRKSAVLLGNQRSRTIVRQCWSFKLEKKYLIPIYEKKKFKKNTQLSFSVKGENLKLRNLPSTSHLCCVYSESRLSASAANSVGTLLESAAFGSGSDTKYSRANAFCLFSVHNHGFCGCPNTFSQEKHPRVYLSSASAPTVKHLSGNHAFIIGNFPWAR